MRYRLARPSVQVDINPIKELSYLEVRDGALFVGAGTRDAALETHPAVGKGYRLIAEAAALVADPAASVRPSPSARDETTFIRHGVIASWCMSSE
jgi:CO/xanthine dehydrogenase FAD-binding subunit